jgi:DNA modification methylase
MKALNQSKGKTWTMFHGDTAEVIRAIPDRSVDFSIFSPPFASLYTYSNSERDMGNCKDQDEFWKHFAFLGPELHRILAPGRLVSVHCMNLPRSKEREGVIGIRDFRGDVVRAMEAAGFVYHSEVTIWKDPVTAMQRTKAIGLLYKQLRKDSALSRQGIPDYLCTFRKRDANEKPITKTHESFPVDRWQRYASPVWMDINPSDTLQKESAREDEDERHICPLQLQVIQRAVELWTNPDDVVFSPFAGIGSEGYVSLREGRRFIGIELKESYYRQAALNLARAEAEATPIGLFDAIADVA